MAEPTSKYTYYDLILRVAKAAGLAYYGSDGSEKAMIPIDTHDLELCKDAINDGIKMFIADAPRSGWRWMRRIMSVTMTGTRITGTADSTSTTTVVDSDLSDTYEDDDDLKDYYCYILTGTGAGSWAKITGYTASTGTITVSDWLDAQGNAGGTDPVADDTFAVTPVETVEGDIARYPLPENFGGEVDGPITYDAETNIACDIEWQSESFLRSERATSIPSGHPRYAAIRPLEPYAGGYGPKRRFEIVFYPEPSSGKTVLFPYTLYFDKLDLVAGDSSAGDTTYLTDSSLANLYPDDYFNGWYIYITSGSGKNGYAEVTDYTGSTGKIEYADLLSKFDDSSADDDADSDSIYYMVPAANLHPAGYRFDEAVLSACLAKAEMDIDDMPAGFFSKYTKKDLPMAIKKDAKSAPKKLGTMNKHTDMEGRFRVRKDVTYDAE